MRGLADRLTVPVLILIVVLFPFVAFQFFDAIPQLGDLQELPSGGAHFEASRLPLTKQEISAITPSSPWIANVQILDFDKDNRLDVVACDVRFNRIVLHRQSDQGWSEKVLGEDLVAPAHATVVDLDQDGHSDVVVSILGNIRPDDSVIGKVVLLRNTGTGFEQQILLDDVRRVADVQAGDLDQDGDIDLVVAVFGYARGEILWLENRGGLKFRDHLLFAAPGTIHVPLADYDNDGDLDIAAVVSQDDEEVWGFENLGRGEFQRHRLFASSNFDLGTAGLVKADLDQDGDTDLILPVGDNLEDIHAYPQPYHGCFWLENKGQWQFESHRIAHLGGTYAAATGDLDADKDLDVVLVSMTNDWDRPGHASVVWLENDGHQKFSTWQIDDRPTQLVTVACGDLNGDGRDDIVAGGLHLARPFRPVAGVTGWLSSGGLKP